MLMMLLNQDQDLLADLSIAICSSLSSSSTRVTLSKLTLFGHNVHKGPAAEGDEDYDEEKEM